MTASPILSFDSLASEPLRLDLGSGPRPRAGFKGVDKVRGLTDYCVNFDWGRPWPFDDDSVDELCSHHCIEHIKNGDVPNWSRIDGVWYPAGEIDALLRFFDEAYRVAKPGAKFEVRCPSAQHIMAHGDPTHRRTISADLLFYLCERGRKERNVEFYGASCNWIGTTDLGCDPPPDHVKPGSVEYAVWESNMVTQMDREWNVGFELIFRLTAAKPNASPPSRGASP